MSRSDKLKQDITGCLGKRVTERQSTDDGFPTNRPRYTNASTKYSLDQARTKATHTQSTLSDNETKELRDVMAGANRYGPLFTREVHEAQQKRKKDLLSPQATAARQSAIDKAKKEASAQRNKEPFTNEELDKLCSDIVGRKCQK